MKTLPQSLLGKAITYTINQKEYLCDFLLDPRIQLSNNLAKQRTKSEKRKKMEEKKAALRAEDMAKGVYILSSSLPHLEPQKAVNSTRTAPFKGVRKEH